MNKHKLSDISRKDPFAVPEGYLHNLPMQIQGMVNQSLTINRQYIRALQLLPRFQMVFSSLVILCITVLAWFVPPATTEQSAEDLLEATSRQEVAQYLNTQSQLSVQELAVLTSWENLEVQPANAFPNSEVLEDEILMDLDTYTVDELWK